MSVQPLLGAHHRLQGGPLGPEALPAGNLLPFGDFLELPVQMGLLLFLQVELGHPALIVDGHRGPILHGPLNVIDADVVPEHPPGALIRQFYGGARKGHKAGPRQSIPHMPGEAVDEVVLAPVGLVGDDHDIPPLRQQRKLVPPLLWEELLDGGEDDPARGHLEQFLEMRPVPGLDGLLPQDLLAPGEDPEELVVQVVPVGEDHDGGVGHGRVEHDLPRKEHHGQALPRALGVPDHPAPAVALRTRRLYRESTASRVAWNW